MSTRTVLRPTVVASAASMAADITSEATVLQSLSMVNYSITWTGSTPIGTVSVQASNDCKVGADGTVTGGTWNKLPLEVDGEMVTDIPLTGNSGQAMIDVFGLSAFAVRLFYERTSGTGSLTATVAGKVS